MDSVQFAVMKDGVRIPYRLDGCLEAEAPVIVLSNPSLVDWSFWDEFLDGFLSISSNNQYRVLRYHNRGRTRHATDSPLTIDTLTEDVLCVLDSLNVKQAAVMVGISLGGLTALNLALKYPTRIAAIMACNFFPSSPPHNQEIWKRRVEVALRDPECPFGPDGERTCGRELAEITVNRWLSPKSLGGSLEPAKIQRLKAMVQENRLDGFASIVQAISTYNLEDGLEAATVPAVFVAGRDDEPVILPMTKMAKRYGKGADLKIIDNAGHLPVVDRPGDFLSSFLEFLGTR